MKSWLLLLRNVVPFKIILATLAFKLSEMHYNQIPSFILPADDLLACFMLELRWHSDAVRSSNCHKWISLVNILTINIISRAQKALPDASCFDLSSFNLIIQILMPALFDMHQLWWFGDIYCYQLNDVVFCNPETCIQWITFLDYSDGYLVVLAHAISCYLIWLLY